MQKMTESCGCGGDCDTRPPEKKLIDSLLGIPIKFAGQEQPKNILIDTNTHEILIEDLINCAGWG
jgi:hypothetical protein